MSFLGGFLSVLRLVIKLCQSQKCLVCFGLALFAVVSLYSYSGPVYSVLLRVRPTMYMQQILVRVGITHFA